MENDVQLDAHLKHHLLTEGRDFKYAWGMFLDAFYRSTAEEKFKMVAQAPESDILSLEVRAFIAAAVHRLCNTCEIPIPEWVFQKQYYLSKPYFVGDPGDLLRLCYLIESPAEFKSRNIFTSANTLSRV